MSIGRPRTKTPEKHYCKRCKALQDHDVYVSKGYRKKECMPCRQRVKKERMERLLAKCVAYKGGKCVLCGLVDHSCVYDFHHRDATTKSFGLNSKKGNSFDSRVEELDKCDLVCARCHSKLRIPSPGCARKSQRTIRWCSKCSEETEHAFHPDKKWESRRFECIACRDKRTQQRMAEYANNCFTYMGGACFACGWVNDFCTYELHHVDPSTKEFNVGHRWSRNFENLKAELDKCVMLCIHCHRKLHAGIIALPQKTLDKKGGFSYDGDYGYEKTTYSSVH